MRGLFKKKPKNPAHRLGQRGEELAKKHLKKQGYKILEANYRCKLGELDLVATWGEYIVFVEVKTRTDLDPLLQMTQAKTKKIRQLALVYLEEKQIRGLQPRFDVIAVTNDGERLRLEHLQNAF
ncbi:MAG: YraN family protein [bacterium]|nr:YraN family protein [bacterium]